MNKADVKTALSATLMAAVFALATAALCGSPKPDPDHAPTAFGPPAGNEARLRIQAVPNSIECGEPSRITVWLDDLPKGAPRLDEGADAGAPTTHEGVTGFQFVLKFDAGVGSVPSRDAIAVGRGLANTVTTSGGKGVWTLVSQSVDNAAGTVFVPVLNTGVDITDPSQIAQTSPVTVGSVNPVDAGQSIELANIDMMGAGSGVSPLTILPDGPLRPQLETQDGASYRPILVTEDTLTVKGNCVVAAPTTTTTATPSPGPRVPVMEPVVQQAPPYPTPTAAPGCGWKLTGSFPIQGNFMVLESPCYDGTYVFNVQTGDFRKASAPRYDDQIDCTGAGPDPRCEQILREISTIMTQTAVASATAAAAERTER